MAQTRFRSIFTLVFMLGFALGVYIFATPDRNGVAVVNSGRQLRGEVRSEHVDATEVADSSQSDDTDLPVEYLSPDTLAIKWRQRPESALNWKDYRASSYDELRALAEEGDGHAAAWLADRLSKCYHHAPPQTDSEINAAIDEMRRTHQVPIYRDGAVERMFDFNNSLNSLETQIETYERTARIRSTITVEQRAEWRDWGNRALALGGPHLLIANILASEMDSDSYTQLVSDLWNAGDPTALLSLSSIYLRASWETHDPSGKIRGYAYSRAMQILTTDYIREHNIPPDSNMGLPFEAELSNQRSRMHAHEIREAERMAKDIVDDNENCCLSWPDYLFDAQ